MKARLSSLPPEQFHEEGLKAAALIQTLPIWSQYAAILLFLSMKNEIDTQPLLEAALAGGVRTGGKKVFAPRLEGDSLVFRRIYSPEGHWYYGSYGIREPSAGRADNDGNDSEADESGSLSAADFPALVIVPALAFDRSGNRLGRGRAYYDRFFAGLDAAGWDYAAIGLCMTTQILPDIPVENWDKKMNGICTAAGFTACL